MSEDWRPGYHAERTFQAWVRSALSTLLAAAVTARLGVLAQIEWVEELGITVAVVTMGCVFLRWRQVGHLGVETAAEKRHPRDLGIALLGIVVAVGCLGVCGLVLAMAELV